MANLSQTQLTAEIFHQQLVLPPVMSLWGIRSGKPLPTTWSGRTEDPNIGVHGGRTKATVEGLFTLDWTSMLWWLWVVFNKSWCVNSSSCNCSANPCHFSINFWISAQSVPISCDVAAIPGKAGWGWSQRGRGSTAANYISRTSAPLRVAANGGSPGWRPGTFAKERSGSVATYKARWEW